MFEATMLKKLGAANDGGAQQPKDMPLMEALTKEFKGYSGANQIVSERLVPTLKRLGSTDLNSIRVMSVSDQTPTIRNEETMLLNYFESKGKAPAIKDYQYKINERDPLTDVADVVNVESTTLFPSKQSLYASRFNTLTCLGNSLSMTIFADQIAKNNGDLNEMEEQIRDQMWRMRRTWNRMLMNNTEQVVEVPTAKPQMGGLFTRSTLNAINAGGANFTNTLLQAGINSIAASLGYRREWMLWMTPAQSPVIRDLMINRFQGENSVAAMQTAQRLRSERLAKFNVPVEQVYEAAPGGVITCIYDGQMPSGTALLFDGSLPRMARFLMGGQEGPFVLYRPEVSLAEVVAVFDLATLDDPLKVSRVRYTNLAA